MSKILHISPTPLVHSPADIVTALNGHTDFETDLIVLNDYPEPLKGCFMQGAIAFNKNESHSLNLCGSLIEDADIIHIHNFVPDEFSRYILSKAKKNVKFVYQVHNFPKEGPVFFNICDYMPINFDAKLVVAQHQARAMQDYIMVPSIINVNHPTIHLLKPRQKPRVLWLPAHKRNESRWGLKYSKVLEDLLTMLVNADMIELISPTTKMRYDELLIYRRTMHISIDEIMTGAYHRVSLEGLACGNVVISGADDCSLLTLNAIARTESNAPFVIANETTIKDVMKDLLSNHDKIRKIQQQSLDFFKKYYMPEKMIKHYTNIYDKLLS